MKTWIRYGLPALVVCMLLPAVLIHEGGAFGGGVYHVVCFVIALPALQVVGWLRDANFLPTPAAEVGALLTILYGLGVALVSVIQWWRRSHRGGR
ncbi:MAG: hypothetical protein JNN01_18050 [Opitutaceae bacterium]|nr:hypothetical protein [Opitutaceae bacterium]